MDCMTKRYAGSYINTDTGVVIERSDNGGWNVINPETGRVLDNMPTLSSARRVYGGPREGWDDPLGNFEH